MPHNQDSNRRSHLHKTRSRNFASTTGRHDRASNKPQHLPYYTSSTLSHPNRTIISIPPLAILILIIFKLKPYPRTLIARCALWPATKTETETAEHTTKTLPPAAAVGEEVTTNAAAEENETVHTIEADLYTGVYISPPQFNRSINFPFSFSFTDTMGKIRTARSYKHKGPVTDYGTSVGKWMMKRRMNWRGQNIDFLRPAPAFIVDVCGPLPCLACSYWDGGKVSDRVCCSCCLLRRIWRIQRVLYRQNIYMLH